MNRGTYEQRIIAVLKGVAVNSGTISTGDLAWAINYQRVSRPIQDLLAELRPVLEDQKWPPLTCLVLSPTQQPALEADRTVDARLQQRGCWAWAIEQSSERQRLRGQWVENSVKAAGHE
jgi:hypothetical protein